MHITDLLIPRDDETLRLSNSIRWISLATLGGYVESFDINRTKAGALKYQQEWLTQAAAAYSDGLEDYDGNPVSYGPEIFTVQYIKVCAAADADGPLDRVIDWLDQHGAANFPQGWSLMVLSGELPHLDSDRAGDLAYWYLSDLL